MLYLNTRQSQLCLWHIHDESRRQSTYFLVALPNSKCATAVAFSSRTIDVWVQQDFHVNQVYYQEMKERNPPVEYLCSFGTLFLNTWIGCTFCQQEHKQQSMVTDSDPPGIWRVKWEGKIPSDTRVTLSKNGRPRRNVKSTHHSRVEETCTHCIRVYLWLVLHTQTRMECFRCQGSYELNDSSLNSLCKISKEA